MNTVETLHPIFRTNLNLLVAGKIIDDKLIKPNSSWKPKEESGLPTPNSKISQKLRTELRSRATFTDPQTGQAFTGLKLNWGEFLPDTSERVIVFLPEYNNPVRKGPPRYRIEELAHQTERPVVGINYPKVDGSSRFTQKQERVLREYGDYGLIALAQLRALKAEGITDIDLVGRSLGGWAAASLAAHAKETGITVHNLVIVDSPGVTEFTEKELIANERTDGSYYNLYLKNPYDKAMRKAGGIHFTRLRYYAGITRWLITMPFNDPDGMERKAMAKKRPFVDNLTKALRTNPEMQMQIITGSESSISPKEPNQKLVFKLREQFAGRVHQSIFPGEPHLVLENGKTFAAIVKLYS